MRQAADLASFLRAPVGQWLPIGELSVVWCASEELAGAAAWGRPDEAQTRAVLQAFGAIRALPGRLDVMLDGSGLESLDPDSLFALLAWGRANLALLRPKVRTRVGVVPEGVDGVTLSGITPMLGWPRVAQVQLRAREAFRMLLG